MRNVCMYDYIMSIYNECPKIITAMRVGVRDTYRHINKSFSNKSSKGSRYTTLLN